MITNIKEISFYDYLLGSALFLPPLGTYLVRHSQTRDGIILGAHFEGKIVGVAVIEFVPRTRLTYVYIDEYFRRQGIGTQLIQASLKYARDKSAVEVETTVILQNEYGETTDHILRKTGFELINTATIIRYANDERCNRIWTAFMEKRGNRICDTLERRGFKTITFSEASSEIFNKLKSCIGREFVPDLDPFTYISNQNDRLLPEYSFMTLKNNDPVAFVTVTTADDKSLVFRQISIALKHQGDGVFLLPFAAFMERFLTGDVYSKGSTVIFGNNDKMQRLVHSFIGSLAESMKTQNIYQFV